MAHEPNIDDTLHQWYAQFDADHERLKQEMVADLPDLYPARPAPRRVNRLAGLFRHPAVRVAACILVIAGVLFVGSSWLARPAYALPDVFRTLVTANRLYFRGTYSSPIVGGGEHPVEAYLERPNTYWKTRIVRKGYVASGYEATDGQTRFRIMDDPREPSWVSDDLPVWATVELESLATMLIGENLIVGDPSDYEYRGKEVFQGANCDVYERRTSETRYYRILVDRSGGIPVRSTCYVGDPGNERILLDIDQIAIRLAAPPAHISFEPPAGTEYVGLPTTIERFPPVIGSTDDSIHVPFAVNIDDQAALICWAVMPSDTYESVDFSLATPNGSKLDSTVIDLGVTLEGGATWHWHLLKPRQPSQAANGLAVRYDIVAPRCHASDSKLPIDLSENQINQLIKSFSEVDSPQVSLQRIHILLGD